MLLVGIQPHLPCLMWWWYFRVKVLHYFLYSISVLQTVWPFGPEHFIIRYHQFPLLREYTYISSLVIIEFQPVDRPTILTVGRFWQGPQLNTQNVSGFSWAGRVGGVMAPVFEESISGCCSQTRGKEPRRGPRTGQELNIHTKSERNRGPQLQRQEEWEVIAPFELDLSLMKVNLR